MGARTSKVALLLFGSGICALIYQVAWLREFRLIFGASTAASAAVLAIFMGGLGLGGAVLGRRADRHPNPLALYAQLELIVAVSAAATPALVWLVRQLYIALGGSVTLGLGGATLARVVLAALVICVPTVAMGGTLPAASKAVETEADVGRRNLALLYGANTLGAVTGALVSTFLMLEVYGTRTTLWLACLLNLLVAVTARSVARGLTDHQGPATDGAGLPAAAASPMPTGDWGAASPPPGFVLAAAAIVGFAFLLMELVWYRMLGPLLGGSTFTFGLILAVALFGIGAGGSAYALRSRERSPTLNGFALTSVLEALCLAYPYALGDRIAFLTIFLRPLGGLGFSGLVLGWTVVVAVVVLPAAFVAGVQFPLLIGLLGRGREGVGRHVGLAYAWNTMGAIAGSLAGGFGLLSVLSATGTWCAVVLLLLALGAGATLLGARPGAGLLQVALPLATTVIALLLLTATGPTAVWRYTPIGAGRVHFEHATPNVLRQFANTARRSLQWAVDGVESSIALDAVDGYALLVNGKSDGNATQDAATQVMGGLLGAIFHPHPTRALVIGLGTGSTAGWLAKVPSMLGVDVVELEPVTLDIARACSAVNEDALANPKVHISIGDARELVLTTPKHYDIIFSEPSNPYRAGVSSLFTREFYQGVAARLAPGGIFVQWLQAYEVDGQAMRTAYATLASVFPVVETWRSLPGDLLLVASMEPIVYDVPRLRARVEQEPFKRALAVAWRTTGLEGLLSRFVARASLARAFAEHEGTFLNTDDQTLMEFAFARSLGDTSLFNAGEIDALAHSREEDRPDLSGGTVDWAAVEDDRLALFAPGTDPAEQEAALSGDQRHRGQAERSFAMGNVDAALTAWRAQPRAPAGPLELLLLAEGLARTGDQSALTYAEQLYAFDSVEAEGVVAVLRWRQGRWAEAAGALETAFRGCRHDPWPVSGFVSRQLDLAVDLGAKDKDLASRLYSVLKVPFAAGVMEDKRKVTAFRLATSLNQGQCVEALRALEPNVPWTSDILHQRLDCYRRADSPQAATAQRDLNTYTAGLPIRLAHGLEVPTAASTE